MIRQTYVGAVNDALTVTIVGPSDVLAELRRYITQQGMLVREMNIRGKTHNPENESLVDELATICQRHANLTLPQAKDLQTPLRSNKDGSLIVDGSLTGELIRTILVTRCEWHTVVNFIADDFVHSPRDLHKILSFGIGDCLPMLPFHRRQVKCTKVDIQSFLAEYALLNASDQPTPPHAVAIIGVSCRFPGAVDFEQLWQLISKGVDSHQELPTDRFDLPGSFRATQSVSFMQGRRFWGNFLDDVKSADREFFGYNSKEMLHMDPQQRLLLELAHEAMESGGLYNREGHTLGSSVGCFIGASYVDYVDNTSSHATTAYNSTGTLRTFLSGRLSYKFSWNGPCEVLDTVCSSSLVAINRAYTAIQNGECSSVANSILYSI
jgi:acyl transferase domain-containing protein